MRFLPVFLIFVFVLSAACSFNYGNTNSEDSGQPDIVMENVEYVRIRGGDPVVRFQAEYAERYEKRKIMNLENFSFEEFENHGTEINAMGRAGEASVELDSGNIRLGKGVRIEVDSEDVIIETEGLRWQDSEKQLSGSQDSDVEIYRSDGTSFIGKDFSANTRDRTWNFDSGAEGSYYDKGSEEEAVPESEPDEAFEAEEDNEPDRNGEWIAKI